MPQATRNRVPPAVADPPAPPYTDVVRGAGMSGPVPWWRDTVRAWVPMLSLAALIVFQMVSMQRQIGELRADLRGEIGSLRTEMHQEIGGLRTEMQKEMGDLRDEVRTEMGTLGERIARLEALMRLPADGDPSRPGR